MKTFLFGCVCFLMCRTATAQFDRLNEISVHPQAIAIAQQNMKLPSGSIQFEDVVLAQITIPWDHGADLPIGYIPLSGVITATLDLKQPQDGRVAKHNLAGLELVRGRHVEIQGEGDLVSSVSIKGKGIIFSAIDLKGSVMALPADLKEKAENVIRDYLENRDEIFFPTKMCMEPLLATLCARLNHKGYLFFDFTTDDKPFAFFVDAFRNFKMGLIAFDRFDDVLKAETHVVVDLIPDFRQPRIHTVGADYLQATVSTDNLKQLDFDVQVQYTDPQGGDRYIYLDLMSERSAKRFKTRDIEQHSLGFGSLVETAGQSEVEEFGYVTVKDLIHYKRNMEKHAIVLRSVKSSDGEELRFAHQNDGLVVELPMASQAGKPFNLSFNYGGNALAQDFGNQLVHFDEYAWWPQPYYYNARPSVNISFKLPKPWLLVSPGKLSKEGHDKEMNWGTFTDERRLLNPNIILGNLKQITYSHKGFDVNYYSYAQEKKTTVKKMDKLAVQYLDFYGNLLGVVPFEEFSVVEVPSLQALRRPVPGVIAVDEQTFNRFSASLKGSQRADTAGFRGINESLAVGLAGLWWNSVVQPASAYDAWFGRGFSEYTAYLMMAVADRDDVEGKFTKRWDARGKYVKNFPISHALSIVDYKNAHIQTDLLQYKAANMIHQIRTEMADDQKFVMLLSGFMQRSNFRAPTTWDFMSALKSVSGQETSGIYQESFIGFVD